MNPRRLPIMLLVVAVGIGALGVVGCTQSHSVWPADKPVRVLVTIPPLASFVQNVGGDHVAIKCLCTDKGPHHREYDVQDTLALPEADLFLAIGLELDEKFAGPLAEKIQNNRPRYVKLGDALPEKLKIHDEHDEHDEHGKDPKDKEAHDHEHGEFDPHVWLGIPQAQAMVLTIRDRLKEVDPSHAADYDANAAKYGRRLENLLTDGRSQLAARKSKKIISFHESLAYFGKSFGLDIVGSIEPGPGAEPAAARLKHLAEVIRDKKIHVVAVEPQYSKNTSAQTLRTEIGPELVLVEVDPLETAEGSGLEDPKWYEIKMRHNIEALAKALP